MKNTKLKTKRDGIASMTAYIVGCSPDYVRKVRNGERNSERIEGVLLNLVEHRENLKKKFQRQSKLDL